MPNFNQTGPNGQGPMTGLRMGRCTKLGANFKNQSAKISDEKLNENNPADIQRFGFGRGFGQGFGRGRGRGMGRQNRSQGGF